MSSVKKQRRRVRYENGGTRPESVGEDETAYEQLLSLLGPDRGERRRRRRIVAPSDSQQPSHDQPGSGGGEMSDGGDGGDSSESGDVEGGDGGEVSDGGDGGEMSDGGDGGEMSDGGDGGEMSDVDMDKGSFKGSSKEMPAVCNCLTDPFREHFETVLTTEEVASLEVPSPPSPPSLSPPLGLVSCRPGLSGRVTDIPCLPRPLSQLQVKQKLCHNWRASQTADTLSDVQRHLFHHMNTYRDVLFSQRTFQNAQEVMRVYVLHAVNHVLKTRSKVLKNNHKLLQASKEGRSIEEPRDQGLTRPKVLILLPFRHSALDVVETITSLLTAPGQGRVHNQRRFRREFSSEVKGERVVPKPSSYTAMFAGNTDDCFRVGVAVSGKVLRLYADFYSSDIIIASPLGLRTVLGAEGEKRDYDFLSSVEVLVLDQTDVFLMQNWEHVTHVMNHLHLKPTEAHGVDFSRVRLWTLNEWSQFYRQTIILSSLITPEINSLLTTYCHNYAGSVRCDADLSREEGSVGQVARQLPQVFARLASPSFTQLPESRLEHFTSEVLPGYHGDLMKGTLIFIPSYFDFVRVRNYMKKQELSFTAISEYTSPSRVSRARTQFYQRMHHYLLYTERAHFFHRYRLRGVRHVVFYSLPNYPDTYSELVNMIEGGEGGGEGGTVDVAYSQWDQLALSRVVGGARAHRMMNSSDTTHMLVTGN